METSEAPDFPNQPSLVLIPQHFGSLLFDHQTVQYLPFDNPATDILEQLRRVEFHRLIGELPADEQQAGHSFCLWLDEAGLLDVNGRLPAHRLELDPPATHLAGPLMVHLEVVGACDLTCSHCFAGDLPRNQKPLLLEEIERLLDDLVSMGVFRISLTGGEPLLRKDLFEVIDAARTRGIHVGVTTNGMKLDATMARRFGQRPDVRLNVSLEGATAATNDAVRGDGCFDRVLDNLKTLREHTSFALAFTIRKQNVDEVADCAELAERCGASTAVFRPLYPVGHARWQPEWMPSYQEYQRALEALSHLGADRCDALDTNADPSHVAAPAHDANGVGSCGAGKLTASISVQGVVNPCSFLGPEFDSENIRDRAFSDIWRDSEGMRAIRQCSGSACSESSDQFAGGCRARSLVLIGDAHSADPWHQQYLEGHGHHPLTTVEIQSEIRSDS